MIRRYLDSYLGGGGTNSIVSSFYSRSKHKMFVLYDKQGNALNDAPRITNNNFQLIYEYIPDGSKIGLLIEHTGNEVYYDISGTMFGDVDFVLIYRFTYKNMDCPILIQGGRANIDSVDIYNKTGIVAYRVPAANTGNNDTSTVLLLDA